MSVSVFDLFTLGIGPSSSHTAGRLALLGRRPIPFHAGEDLVFRRGELLPLHSNGLRFTAQDAAGGTLETGADMKTKYKETSRGGLAINVIEC